jgi:hypothetical protein
VIPPVRAKVTGIFFGKGLAAGPPAGDGFVDFEPIMAITKVFP